MLTKEVFNELDSIIEREQLSALFQPIIAMNNAQIIGYEGLIRGPINSPLHSPVNLFRAAAQSGRLLEVERLSRWAVLKSFNKLQLFGKLFLNVSPETLLQPHFEEGETLNYIDGLGLNPERVIIELTENQPSSDYSLLREAAIHYRSMGFKIALDDLGEGSSGLRLWLELQPDYVKIDMHFIQGINHDPVKLQFVRSIQQIAENSDTKIIAEGIETSGELMVVKDLGLAYGQGYHIAYPSAVPDTSPPQEVTDTIRSSAISVYPQSGLLSQKTITARKLLLKVPYTTPDMSNEAVYEIFANDFQLNMLPIIENGIPVGQITRNVLTLRLASRFGQALYGRKPVSLFMNTSPLIVDKNISIAELSQLVINSEQRYLYEGFIITDQGQYAGIGTGHDLMREITEMQVRAARYANPLTLLPGNVPTSEHIDRLLNSKATFHACYADLDNFKPYNDVYGYSKGDDIIQLLAGILQENSDPERDFVGHIGGDDFVILFQSEDWKERSETILEEFEAGASSHYNEVDRITGGITTEDRKGHRTFFPMTSLSLGVVAIEPGRFKSHHEVAASAAEAKRQAKRTPGNSLFIERRKFHSRQPS